jgi:sn-glycerol 3-phosphate transport system permease protein
MGLVNTYTGLIVPLIASATGTFFFRQFFVSVPDELVEAARIDGAGPWSSSLRTSLVPLSQTMIAAIFIIMFVYRLEPVSLADLDHHRGRPCSRSCAAFKQIIQVLGWRTDPRVLDEAMALAILAIAAARSHRGDLPELVRQRAYRIR